MKRIVLARDPDGPLTPDNFRLENVDEPVPGDGEFLIRSVFFGLEPRQRTVINPTTDDNREMRPHGAMCGPGKVIPGTVLGEVVQSRHPGYPNGALVESFTGWSEFAVSDGKPHPTNNPAGVQILDHTLGGIEHHVGLFGLPGMTALLAVRYEGKLQPGETMVVTTAAGMVGSIAAQLGKLWGARVVGLTSREEKCAYLRDELGLDAALNYRESPDLTAEVGAACPDGVDYFFDNCGGPAADAVKAHMNPCARYTGCGFVANYEKKNWGQSDMFRGVFMIHHYVDEYPAARRELADMLKNGQIGVRTTIFDGIETTPGAFIALLRGDNIGKYLVRVGPDPDCTVK